MTNILDRLKAVVEQELTAIKTEVTNEYLSVTSTVFHQAEQLANSAAHVALEDVQRLITVLQGIETKLKDVQTASQTPPTPPTA